MLFKIKEETGHNKSSWLITVAAEGVCAADLVVMVVALSIVNRHCHVPVKGTKEVFFLV